MKKSIRRVLGILLAAVIMCGALAGCAGNETPESTATGPDGSVQETVTLTIWCQSTNQAEYLQWAKEAFEAENPYIKLKVEPQNSNALGDSLEVTLGNADAPDIVATWSGMVANKLFKGGQILAISDVITEEMEQELVEAIAPNKADGNGEHVGMPIGGLVSPVIYYNKTEFDRLGIQQPTTYDELKAAAETIRAAGKQPMIAGFNTWHLPHFMQGIHARTMTPENYEKLLGLPTDMNPYELPGYVEGFELLKKYNDDKIFADNITGFDANMAQMEFVAQNALMLTAPSLDVATLTDACTFELGAFLLPAGEVDGPLASGVYSDVLCINANSQNVDACKTFFNFLLTDEAQAKQLEYELLPIKKGVDITAGNPVLQDVLKEVSENGVSGFYQSYSVPGIDVQLVNAGSSLLTGATDAQGAAQMIIDFYAANMLQ